MANGGPPAREEIDAKLAALAANWRGDMGRLEAKLDAMAAYLPSRGYMAWAIMAAVFTVIIGLATIDGLMYDRFEGGVATRDSLNPVIQPLVKAQEKRDKAQEERLNRLIEAQNKRAADQEKRDSGQDQKLDQILNAVESIRDQSQGSPSQGQDG